MVFVLKNILDKFSFGLQIVMALEDYRSLSNTFYGNNVKVNICFVGLIDCVDFCKLFQRCRQMLRMVKDQGC